MRETDAERDLRLTQITRETITTETRTTIKEELLTTAALPQPVKALSMPATWKRGQAPAGTFWDVPIPMQFEDMRGNPTVEWIEPGDELWEQARRRLREYWREKYPDGAPVPNVHALVSELERLYQEWA